jgi:hypothetical protein
VKPSKKSSKNLLTNDVRCAIIIVQERERFLPPLLLSLSKLQKKVSKKGLTNRTRCAIIRM